MKVIDWLLRVSNGEIHEDTEFKINGEKIEGIKDLGEYKILSKELLNSTVEIIEEDKKIDYIYHCCMEPSSEETKFLIQNINDLADKINDIIDVLNEMRKRAEIS